jgi:hypothetical protein
MDDNHAFYEEKPHVNHKAWFVCNY